MKEDEILKGIASDRARQCMDNYSITNTHFLDMRQRTLIYNACLKNISVKSVFCSGYGDGERTICVFLPDYVHKEEYKTFDDYFAENEGLSPLGMVRVIKKNDEIISHRDYLGSILGLGIKREMIGDILVNQEGADIIVMKELVPFLEKEYFKVGRHPVKAVGTPMLELKKEEKKFLEKKDTVASLRLDNVTASAFSVSRATAAESIEKGLVYINGLQVLKPDKLVGEGEKIVLRGKGKVVLKEIGDASRKNRIYIIIEKYI